MITDQQKILTKFNNFFTNLGENLAKKFDNVLKTHVNNSFKT